MPAPLRDFLFIELLRGTCLITEGTDLMPVSTLGVRISDLLTGEVVVKSTKSAASSEEEEETILRLTGFLHLRSGVKIPSEEEEAKCVAVPAAATGSTLAREEEGGTVLPSLESKEGDAC